MKSKLKVVFLHPPLYPTNNDFFERLGKYCNLRIYSYGEHPKLHKQWVIKEKPKNYKLIFLGTGSLNLKIQLNINPFLEIIKYKPDIVISVAFWIPSLFASIFKSIYGYKFLITTDAIENTEKNISIAKKILRKFMISKTDAVISASCLTTKYFSKNFNYPKNKIFESCHTIDINSWISELKELPSKIDLKKELNIPKDKTVFLGVGNLTNKKNWSIAIDTVEKINDSILIIVGDGEEKNILANKIKNNNLGNRVFLVGRKDKNELKKYFKIVDIFVFPSIYDQFGYVVVEALASELPVLCSKNSGASCLIKDDVNGFIISPYKTFEDEAYKIIYNLNKKTSYISHNLLNIEKKVIDNMIFLKKVFYNEFYK